MWVRLWILSSSQVKGNCHQVTISFHLIKPYFPFNDVNQDLHYNGSVETLKKISGRDDSVQSPGSHIIQWNLLQIPRLFSNSLCIKWDISLVFIKVICSLNQHMTKAQNLKYLI